MSVLAELSWPYYCHHHASTQPSGEILSNAEENSWDKEIDDDA